MIIHLFVVNYTDDCCSVLITLVPNCNGDFELQQAGAELGKAQPS